MCKVIDLFSRKEIIFEEETDPTTKYKYKKLEEFINENYQSVIRTETTLKNELCSIECNLTDEVNGLDLKDLYNEPRFYNKTKRGLKKAWKALQDQFNELTTMHDAMIILEQNNIRTHSYCAMD